MRYLNTKYAIVALLIASVILLCPVNPVSSAVTSCSMGAGSMSDHNTKAGGSDVGCSGTHSEIGSHVLSPAAPFDYLALLFLAFFTVIFFVPFRQWYQTINNFYSTKLNFHRHRYRVIIKPKLGVALLRWLSLLGCTVAFSS